MIYCEPIFRLIRRQGVVVYQIKFRKRNENNEWRKVKEEA